MAKVTYTDKVSLAPSGSPDVNTWRDNDANEVKTVVNANDTITTSTSNTVAFDKIQGYRHGSWAIPIVGNIVLNTSGAVEGACAVVIWNGSTSPTFTGGTIQSYSGNVTESGTYSVYLHYLNGRFNVNVFNVDGYVDISTSYYLSFNSSLNESGTTGAVYDGTGITNIDVRMKASLTEVAASQRLFAYGVGSSKDNVFAGINAGKFIVGHTSGFHNYTISNVSGKSLRMVFNTITTTMTVDLYADDVLLTPDSTSGTFGTVDIDGLSPIFYLGKSPTGTTEWGGDIYPTSLYLNGSLYSYWGMTEGSGSTLSDSNNSRDITLSSDGVINDMWNEI